MTKRDGKNVTQIRLEDELYEKLTALVNHFDYPEKGGRSKIISELIRKAKIKGAEVTPDEFLSSYEYEAIRLQYANLSRIGGNLNQLVSLAQHERVAFENKEGEFIHIKVPLLIEYIEELQDELIDTKEKMVKLLELA